jgi:hypothetical protein
MAPRRVANHQRARVDGQPHEAKNEAGLNRFGHATNVQKPVRAGMDREIENSGRAQENFVPEGLIPEKSPRLADQRCFPA